MVHVVQRFDDRFLIFWKLGARNVASLGIFKLYDKQKKHGSLWWKLV